MAKTGAERVAAYRQRQVDQIASLSAQVADLESRLARAEAAVQRLRSQNEGLRADLDARGAASEPEAEAASGCVPDCPSAAIDNGRCTICGKWV